MAFYNRNKLKLQEALAKLDVAQRRVDELESDFQAVEQAFAVLVMTQDGIIEHANDQFCDLLGYERNDLIGQHHRLLCGSEYAGSEDYIRFWRELVTGNIKHGNFPAVHAAGHDVSVAARYSPVMSEQGVSRRIIALVSGLHSTEPQGHSDRGR